MLSASEGEANSGVGEARMEIRDLASLAANAHDAGDGATVTPLYPGTSLAQGLVAVDLWEIAPGGSITSHAHVEEHVLFVLSGEGRLMGGGEGGVVASVREHMVIALAPHESHRLKNNGTTPLRLLVATPLLVRSERAYGVPGVRKAGAEAAPGVEAPREKESTISRIAERPTPLDDAPERVRAKPAATQVPEIESAMPAPPGSAEEAPANVAGIMRRASELKDQPRPERRRPAPPPEEEPQADMQSQPEEEAEEQSNLMELFVAFDGDTRGTAAQGFGRYLVQAPGRKAIVKSAEFDNNYTPAQAQYEALIEGLRYIGSRLEATGRTPQQVQLDIRAANESVVNGLLGTMKVKEPALKKRQEQALSLLSNFADWRIEWHSPEESASLLG